MIMRYQSISPDSLPLNNGRRSNSSSNSNWKTCKEDEDRVEINGNVTVKTSSSTFEGKGLSRFRSPSRTSQDHHISCNGDGAIGSEDPNSPLITSAAAARNHQNLESNGIAGGGGDTFLQWGHRKRSRCSRGIALTDDTSSPTPTHQFPSAKLQRKSVPQSSSPNANLMPPPSHSSSDGLARGPTLKSPSKIVSSTASPARRNLEERSAGGGGSKSPPSNSVGIGASNNRAVSCRSRVGKRSPSLEKKNPSSARNEKSEKMIGYSSLQQQQQNHQAAVNSDALNHIVSPPQGVGCTSAMRDDNHVNDNAARTAKLTGRGGGGEKVNCGGGGGSEVHEWPRIYIPLTRKEKEEDFFAMKGTKLPHRPKKRPKATDRMLQYCFPGMWLSDLSRGRYEVREKKCSSKKQKRRGLKGMESMESDSEWS